MKWRRRVLTIIKRLKVGGALTLKIALGYGAKTLAAWVVHSGK
jgi:hypothetical protein